MKHRLIAFVTLAAAFVSSPSAPAQAPSQGGTQKNRIGLSYRLGFNIDTRFSNRSPAPFRNNPSVTGLSYRDGFVGTDTSGNTGGLTSFWGYQDAGQVQDGNAVLLMTSSGSGSLGKDNNGLLHGAELTFNHEFGRRDHLSWGLEAAFNFASADSDRTATAGMLTVDSFPLGYAPPAPPYIGPATPGPFVPLLGTTPTRLAPVSVQNALDSSFYGFRVGPTLDWRVSRTVRLSLGGGLAFVVADGEYRYAEWLTTPGGNLIARRGGTSETDVLLGGYVGGQLAVDLSERVHVFSGIQYQGIQSFELRANDKKATVDFGGAFYWTVGLGFSF